MLVMLTTCYSVYQVFVLPVVGAMLFDCSHPPPLQHLAAQLDLRQVGTEVNFTVGDGHYYGGVFNAPLERGRNYYVVLRAVRHWRGVSSCSAGQSKCIDPELFQTQDSLSPPAGVHEFLHPLGQSSG